MYHHLLCEGHTLLRSQLLLQPLPPPLGSRATPQALSSEATELVSNLRKSCLALSLSLCRYNTGKADISAAAKYLLLSKHKIRHILETFLSKFPRVSWKCLMYTVILSSVSVSCQSASPPYTILLKYLELVLFAEELHETGMMEAQPADTVLQLYADFRPQQLPRLLLNSWLHQAFTPSEPLPLSPSHSLSFSLCSFLVVHSYSS